MSATKLTLEWTKVGSENIFTSTNKYFYAVIKYFYCPADRVPDDVRVPGCGRGSGRVSAAGAAAVPRLPWPHPRLLPLPRDGGRHSRQAARCPRLQVIVCYCGFTDELLSAKHTCKCKS